MGSGFIFYVVVTADGQPRRRKHGGTLMVYEQIARAKSMCRKGDAVMRLPMDLGQEPVFIKGQPVEAEDDDGDA